MVPSCAPLSAPALLLAILVSSPWARPLPAQNLVVVPAAADLGQVPVGRQRSQTLTLLNPGPGPRLVHAVYVSGTAFDLPAPPVTAVARSLAVGDSLSTRLRYRPLEPGRALEHLGVVVEGDTQLVALRGEGTRVLIAEVLADPPAGLSGDANGDGVRHTYGDEFVEMWNAGPDSVALDGWRLGDDDTHIEGWFRFPAGCVLPPDGRAVVFGGGSPTGLSVPAYADDGRLGDGLANGGDLVVLADADGDTADVVVGVGWGDDQSRERLPGGGQLIPHRAPPGRGVAFSPGRPRIVLDSLRVHPRELELTEGALGQLTALGYWSDGGEDSLAAAWHSSGPTVAAVDGEGVVAALDSGQAVVVARWCEVAEGSCVVRVRPPHLEPLRFRVVIDEVLADPPTGDRGDANGDGHRHGYEDEFVELYNAGPDTATLGGWSVSDDDTAPGQWFRFPTGTRLPPGERLTLFGGGVPAPGLGLAFADDGRIGNGLTNGGDRLLLVSAAGDTVDMVDVTPWPADQSVVRWPPIAPAGPGQPVPPPPDPAAFTPHGAAPGEGQPFSPGQARTLLPPPANRAPRLSLPDSAWVFSRHRLRLDLAPGDPDGDPVTVTLVEAPSWIALEAGALTGLAPSATLSHRARVQLAVSDGASSTLAATWLVSMPWPDLAVTEILADPPSGEAGDANGDGSRHGYEDEFVEILNRGPPLDVSGWALSDDDTSPQRRFRFPAGTVLYRGQRLVLFGGGNPRGLPGLVFVDDGRLGSGLGNGGDRLLLVCDNPPDTVLDITYETDIRHQALLLDATGRATAHRALPGWTAFSPGTPRPVLSGYRVDPLEIMTSETVALRLWGLAPDTTVSLPADAALWLPLDRGIVEVSQRGQARGRRPGSTMVEAWINGRVAALGQVQVRRPPAPPNEPPRFTATPDTLCLAGGNYRFGATAEDPEGALLSYCPVHLPPWLRLGRVDGLLTGQVPDEPGQTWEVALQVTDGRSGLAVLEYALHAVARPHLRITEVLADPPGGLAGDANGDGVRHPYEDEFVELYNAGTDTVYLTGWELRDANARGSGAFTFPPGSALAPAARSVVFGGGRPPPGALAGTGRLGDGLGNTGDAVYLVAPDGPDTIAAAAWDLARGPDESLCWTGDAPPERHGAWPGRDAFSPGRPRARLRSLRTIPTQVSVAAGQADTVRVVGMYSDGRALLVGGSPPAGWPELTWTSGDAEVAAVGPGGVVQARAPGVTSLTARLDTFGASLPVQVRVPVAQRVIFSPGWSAQTVASGRSLSFAAVSSGNGHLAYQWWVNDMPQRVTAGHLSFARQGGSRPADTVRVTVRERRPDAHRPESLERSWVLRGNTPPLLHPLADTVASVGQLFRTRLSATDPDGDRPAFFLMGGPPGMRLSALEGELDWTPAPADTGRISLRVRVTDGLDSTVDTRHLVVLAPAARPVAGARVLRVWPNPFRRWESLRWEVTAPCADPEVRVYNAAGQLILRLPVVAAGAGARGGGAPQPGCPTAAGVYVAALWCGRPVAVTRLLLLR